jgi:hypothetical protein
MSPLPFESNALSKAQHQSAFSCVANVIDFGSGLLRLQQADMRRRHLSG